MGGRAASSAVRERREYVSWPGIGAPARSRSRSSLVGSVANGWRGIRVSERICWPATPNFVKHRSFRAWCHADQLSLGRSRMTVVESMVYTISNCQVCGLKSIRYNQNCL